MAGLRRNRILAERALVHGEGHAPARKGGRRRPARSVTVNLTEAPLGWLKARGLVTQRQFEAAERLREQWDYAGLEPSVTMRWEASPAASGERAWGRLEPTERQLAARRRFEDAVAATGHGLGDIMWRIVCAGEGMREAERALGWPARSGKLVLGLALDRLADHYRIR